MSIKYYGAGNFVLLSSPEKEEMFQKEIEKRMGEFNRLISFFFKKELETVLTVNQKGEFDEN